MFLKGNERIPLLCHYRGWFIVSPLVVPTQDQTLVDEHRSRESTMRHNSQALITNEYYQTSLNILMVSSPPAVAIAPEADLHQ